MALCDHGQQSAEQNQEKLSYTSQPTQNQASSLYLKMALQEYKQRNTALPHLQQNSDTTVAGKAKGERSSLNYNDLHIPFG